MRTILIDLQRVDAGGSADRCLHDHVSGHAATRALHTVAKDGTADVKAPEGATPVPIGIHHSVVVVRDLEASLRFYRDGLGLDLLAGPACRG
jgi:hypothetical protein